MSSLCGIFGRSGRPVLAESIEGMTATLHHWQGDGSGTWRNPSGTVALGHVKLTNTPESLGEILPFHHPASRLTITADARIDNREVLYQQLDIPLQEQNCIPDSQLILQAYQKWGRECTAHLIGDFAFAIWDERAKQLFCARDQMGSKPLFYFLSNDWFIFATEMKGIFKVTGEPRALNQNWISDALTAMVADKEYTPYPEIRRLLPAHWFSISPVEIKKQCYWNLNPGIELHLPSEDDYVETFREKLTEAVRCRVRSAFPIGSELSGGLDSSTVTALAARQAETRNLKFITFSHVLGEEVQSPVGLMTDESDFAALLLRYAGIRYSHNLTSQGRGVMETLKNALHVQDGPTMYNFFNYSDVLYETGAKDGIRTLLSGLGGDEMVSFQARGYLEELAYHKKWQDLWREYRRETSQRKKSPWKNILREVAKSYLPSLKTVYRSIRDRHSTARENSPAFHIETFSLNPGFYQEAGVQQRLNTITRVPRGGSVRSLQYRRIMHPYIPLRMEYCSIAAATHRIEYRYPLLDIRLLEFHLAVPSRLKRKDGSGRYLFRKAIEGIVPPGIQWRDDKSGATIPANFQRFIRDAEEIRNLITLSQHNKSAYYLDLEQMKMRLDRIMKREESRVPPRRNAYLNALMLLLYFEGIEDDQ